MPRLQRLLGAVVLCACSGAFPAKPAQGQAGGCSRPAPGNHAGSCEALKSKDGEDSRHVGDVWIRCEETSGEHGTGGRGAAEFLATEGTEYWLEEVDRYLATLEKLRPPEEVKKLRREHGKWEKGLQAERDRAYKEAAEEYGEGSAAFYAGAWGELKVIRHRALELGCMIESSRK